MVSDINFWTLSKTNQLLLLYFMPNSVISHYLSKNVLRRLQSRISQQHNEKRIANNAEAMQFQKL